MTVSRVWICLVVWTAAATQTRATQTVLYPKIGGTETLTCECPDHTCQEVFWYRYLEEKNSLQFVLYYNSAGSENHGDRITDKHRFRGSGSLGQRPSFTLRITGLQKNETGLYSCMFKIKNTFPNGYYIRPGANPPTLEPPVVKMEKPKWSCRSCKPLSPKGCKRSVLWPGIGVLLLLAVILAGTLYYFSRLPKKCRHQFAKTNQLR